MQAALEVAAYALGFTILLGLLLVGLLVKDLFLGGGFKVPHPEYLRLPIRALAEARRVLEALKAAAAPAGAGRRLELHLRRMRERVEYLEEKTLTDQEGYYHAVAQRERAWRNWKAVFQQIQALPHAARARAKFHLEDAEQAFRQSERRVREEWERGQVRDRLLLEELKHLGVLEPDYIPGLLAPEASEADGTEDLSPVAPGRELPPSAPVLSLGRRGDGIGILSYRRLLEIVGSMFRGRPAVPRPAPPPQVTAEDTGFQRTTEFPSAEELNMRQGDIQAGVSLPGRRYADPEFSLAALPKGILAGADLSACSFLGVAFVGVQRHVDCRWAGADLGSMDLAPQERPHQFARCNFSGTNFSDAHIRHATFFQCDLSGSHWAGAVLERVKFVECRVEGVQWAGADLGGVLFSDEARGADFSLAGAPPRFFAAPTLGRPGGAPEKPADDASAAGPRDAQAPVTEPERAASTPGALANPPAKG
jgi:hypothetical protein